MRRLRNVIVLFMVLVLALGATGITAFAATGDAAFAVNTVQTGGSTPARGIDVSSYQGKINWAAVKKSGKVHFAIIRGLHWNTSRNNYAIDPYFDYNVREAKKYGIKVGVYLFSYAFNKRQMAQEIRYFARNRVVKKHAREGIEYDLPVFIDYESNLILKNTTYNQRTDILRYGMDLLENRYGYKSGFYTNLNWARRLYDAKKLQREGYDFWLANYGKDVIHKKHNQHGWKGEPLAIWQYSSNGRVAGIKGRVDLNWCYKAYDFTPLPSRGDAED